MHPQCTSGDISVSNLATGIHELQQWKGLAHKDSITSNSTLRRKHVFVLTWKQSPSENYKVLKKKKKPLIFKNIQTCPRENQTTQEFTEMHPTSFPPLLLNALPSLPPPEGRTEPSTQLQHWGAAALLSQPTLPPSGKGSRMAALRRLLQVYFLLLLFL